MKRLFRSCSSGADKASAIMFLGFGTATGMAFAALSLLFTHAIAGMIVAFIVGFGLGCWYIGEKSVALDGDDHRRSSPCPIVVVSAGELIPCNGVVIEGSALVDESAIAGVSTPAFIEAGAGRCQVFEGGLVKEGSLKIRCTPSV